MYVNFWFEAEGIKLRHHIGIDNIMWESDFPHVASFYPRSWESIERVVDGVPPEDRRKLLYENALRVYGIETTVSAKTNKRTFHATEIRLDQRRRSHSGAAGFVDAASFQEPLGRPHSPSPTPNDGTERWVVDGQLLLDGCAGRAGALMADRNREPSRWEDVPPAAYVPSERLKAMDAAGIDYSVLYPTVAGLAGETFGRLEDPELELACVQAYNDWLIDEWASASDRFIPQCIVPIGPVESTVAEIRSGRCQGPPWCRLPFSAHAPALRPPRQRTRI